jgi:transposase InsO family protein
MLSSMSRNGDPWDNAVAESFIKSLKIERIYWRHYQTRDEARRDIFQYIEVMCRVLGVSRSSYHDWTGRETSRREAEDERLLETIKEVFKESKENYGSRRVHKQLVSDGETCSRRRVERLMRKCGIRPKVKKRFVVTTDSRHDLPVADNLLGRDFQVQEPDQVWVSDITYIPTGEGWLYFAGVVDLYNREVVGWSMSERIDRHLVIAALDMAIGRRHPLPGLVAHSDRGSQYASLDYQKELARHGLVCSMSGKGDPWDNAVMESFFGSLKTELVHHWHYRTREEAGGISSSISKSSITESDCIRHWITSHHSSSQPIKWHKPLNNVSEIPGTGQFETWGIQGRNTIDACRLMLASYN